MRKLYGLLLAVFLAPLLPAQSPSLVLTLPAGTNDAVCSATMTKACMKEFVVKVGGVEKGRIAYVQGTPTYPIPSTMLGAISPGTAIAVDVVFLDEYGAQKQQAYKTITVPQPYLPSFLGSGSLAWGQGVIGGGGPGGGNTGGSAVAVAPTLSSIGHSENSNSVTYTWTSDVGADTQLCVGSVGGPYTNCSALDTNSVTSHSATIGSGLSPSTTYGAVIKSRGSVSGLLRTCNSDVTGCPAGTELTFTTSAAGSQLLPSGGILVNGTINNEVGFERNVIVPGHWSDTQYKPAAFSVTASGCVRASNVVTCTTTTDPTATVPRLYIGFSVVVAGMADSSFNGTFVLTNVTSNSLVWAQTAANATTDTGTIRSTLLARPAQGGTYTDPQFNVVVTRLYDHLNGPGTCPTNGVTHEYVNISPWSLNLTHMILKCRSGSHFILNMTTKAATCYGSMNSASGEPTWSRTDNDVVYFVSGNKLRKMLVSTCGTSDVITFTGFTNAYIAGEGATRDGSAQANTAKTKTLVPMILYATGPVRHVTVAVAEDATYPTPYNTTCSGSCFVDTFQTFPSGKAVVKFNVVGSGITQGAHLLNADMTYNRQITTSTGHSTLSTSVEGAEIIAMYRNESGTSGPCSTKAQGMLFYDVATSTGTCGWNRMNNDFAGTGSSGVGTHVSSGDTGSQWTVIDNRDVSRAAYETQPSGIGSAWDTAWPRGGSTIGLVKMTTAGTPRTYLLGFTHSAVAYPNGTEVYHATPFCAPSHIEPGVNATSVPKYIVCNVDFRLGASGGYVNHEPVLYTVR